MIPDRLTAEQLEYLKTLHVTPNQIYELTKLKSALDSFEVQLQKVGAATQKLMRDHNCEESDGCIQLIARLLDKTFKDTEDAMWGILLDHPESRPPLSSTSRTLTITLSQLVTVQCRG